MNVEKDVINYELVTQFLRDPLLTTQEKRLLEYKYKNPRASYTEIAYAIGLDHHEKARRLFKQISEKLKHYA